MKLGLAAAIRCMFLGMGLKSQEKMNVEHRTSNVQRRMKSKENIEPRRPKGREEGFLLLCYDPEREAQDHNTPSPDGRE